MTGKSPFQLMNVLWVCFCLSFQAFSAEEIAVGETIKLPPPREKSNVSIEEALWKRQSIRSFASQVPTWEQVAQLLWAAQGVNRPDLNKRTAPSAGGVYPMVLYVVLPQGIYRYVPEDHTAVPMKAGDTKKYLSEAGLEQSTLYASPCVFVFCAEVEKTRAKFKDYASRYIFEEAGHAAQNILLQSISLGMGGVPIGAIVGSEAQKALGIPLEQEVVYLIATGFEKKPE